MLVKGRILDTEGQPIEAAKIDVWQANDEGFYDVQQKGLQPDFNLRGVFERVPMAATFPRVKPSSTDPTDGPVGQMLISWAAIRTAAHLHYILEAEG